MAVLVDLLDEMILNIGTFIPHPPDILNFTRTCKRAYKLILPLLYEDITLDYELYRSSRHNTCSKRRLGQAQPHLAIKKLVRTFEDDHNSGSPRICSVVRCLALRVPTNIDDLCHGLYLLVRRMTALVDLRLEILGRDRSEFVPFDNEGEDPRATRHDISPQLRQGVPLNLETLNSILQPTNTTLKTLTTFTDSFWMLEDGYVIGDLSSFRAVKYLDIQGEVFHGWQHYRKQDSPEWLRGLSNRLPPNLRTLQLRCYSSIGGTRGTVLGSFDPRWGFIEGVRTMKILQKYPEMSERSQTLLAKVVIWFPEIEKSSGKLRMLRDVNEEKRERIEKRYVSMLDREGKNSIEEIGRLIPKLEALACQNDITVVTKTMDDLQPGRHQFGRGLK